MAQRRAALNFAAQLLRQQGQQETLTMASAGCSAVEGAVHQSARNASQLAVKQRMRSVTNIQKITKAMKMVAASKMRNAQSAVIKSRGLALPLVRLLGDRPDVQVAKNVTVPITSDRGLCGGVNTSVCKFSRIVNRIVRDDGNDVSLVVLGEKGKSQLQRDSRASIVETIADYGKVKITFPMASAVAEEILKTEYDVARLVFNKFRSAISYKATIATVLSPETLEKDAEAGSMLDSYEIEGPDRAELLQDLGEFQLAATLYNALVENNCSEFASRMAAMESSTKNATEMLGKLTLSYNRSRQAKITTELIEIISGAAALEG